MTERHIDLDAYFERIGYHGVRTATLDTLCALHELHPAAIPFENLTPYSGGPVSLDLADLEQKLIHERRGGYCFEHNLLLLDVLRTLGFAVSGLAARVLWNQPEDAITARGHMLLRVEIGGSTYIVDVGFGGQTLTAPLRLEEGVPQATPHEPFRLVRHADGDLRMQSEIAGVWKTLYRFDLARALLPDYAVSNYFLSTHPDSHFRSRLLVARSGPGVRFALLDRKLTVHGPGGASDSRVLSTPGELRAALSDTFGIRVPDTPELDAAFDRLF